MGLKSSIQLAVASTSLFVSGVFGAFGYTTSGNNYIIDAGSSNPLVFSVSRSNCDINSIKYRGTELKYSSQGTHIGSGLGSATVSVSQSSGTFKYIKVTCVTSTLTHYMVVREGDSTIFMADYLTAQPSIGELRFIGRLLPDKLPNEYPYGAVSNTNGASSSVEMRGDRGKFPSTWISLSVKSMQSRGPATPRFSIAAILCPVFAPRTKLISTLSFSLSFTTQRIKQPASTIDQTGKQRNKLLPTHRHRQNWLSDL